MIKNLYNKLPSANKEELIWKIQTFVSEFSSDKSNKLNIQINEVLINEFLKIYSNTNYISTIDDQIFIVAQALFQFPLRINGI